MDVDKIKVKGLTRGQIKELRKEGVVLAEIEKLEDEKQDEALDRIFEWACPEEFNADELTPGQGLELYVRIIAKTYAGDRLLKKSQSPPLSSLASGDSTVRSVKKRKSRRKGTVRKSKKKSG